MLLCSCGVIKAISVLPRINAQTSTKIPTFASVFTRLLPVVEDIFRSRTPQDWFPQACQEHDRETAGCVDECYCVFRPLCRQREKILYEASRSCQRYGRR